MPRKMTFNHQELVTGGRIDGRNANSIPDSVMSRSAKDGLHAEIELLVKNITEKPQSIKDKVMHDLHLARVGTEDQVTQARLRLAKVGILQSWSQEQLEVIQNRLEEEKLNVKGPDYAKDPKYGDFHKLFKSPKAKEIQ